MHHIIKGIPPRGMALAILLACALFLVLYPVPGMALGLGRLKVHSALNEPLNAEIDIVSISDKELKGLAVGLATRAEYDQAGIDRPAFLAQLKFSVSKRLDGRYFIQLRSDEPIREPFLHVLLRIEWPGGRLVREYTALIDPPLQVAGRPAGIEVPTAAPSVVPRPPPSLAPASEQAPPVTSVTPEPALSAEQREQTEVAKAEPFAIPQPAPAPLVDEELLGPPVTGDVLVISKESGWPEEVTPTVEPLAPTSEEKKIAMPLAELQSVVRAADWSKIKEYTVKRGDTLWHIAERVRADDSLSLEQVMLAIYNANRHAFFANNLNNLRAGRILRIPERKDVESLSTAQARKEFRAHYDVWQEYKRVLVATSSRTIAPTTGVPDAAVRETAPPKPAEQAEAPPAKAAAPTAGQPPATTGSQSAQSDQLLKIVRANLEEEKGTAVAEGESTKDTAGKERQALAERVITLEESLASKEMENRDLTEKVGKVRAQLKNQARLLELESKELAVAQTQLQSGMTTEPPAKSETPQPETVKPADPSRSAATPSLPAAKPAPVEKVRLPKPAPPKPAASPPPDEPGFVAALMETLTGGLLVPVILAGVVVAVGGLALLYFHRRRQSLAEFEESILSSEAISTDSPATTDTAGQQVITADGDTSFLSDFSQGGMGNVHPDVVDPIAEAEVYLAYGRDETAEEILKEAIVKNPERHELRLKLLEIYHQRNDVGAFESVAEELYAALGSRGGKIWDRVEEMGRKLNPENPMFRGGAPAGRAAAAAPAHPSITPATAATANLAGSSPGGAKDGGAPAESAVKPHPAFDFEIETPMPAASAPSATTFDLDLEPTKVATKVAPPAADSESLDIGAPAAGSNLVEFDFGEPSPGLAQTESAKMKWEGEAPAAEVSAAGAEAGSLTGEVTGGETVQHWDETATKLDLAKAYIDMGDAEGARSILEEVMAEGNEQQKQQAQELAAQIA